jgi:hypothetical protein
MKELCNVWILIAVIEIIPFNQVNYFLSIFVLPSPVFMDEELWLSPT